MLCEPDIPGTFSPVTRRAAVVKKTCTVRGKGYILDIHRLGRQIGA